MLILMDWSLILNKFRYKMQNFMRYRYGVDTLSKHSMNLTLILLVLNIFLRSQILNLLILLLAVWTNYRMFSKKTYKRSKENRMYLKSVRTFKLKIERLKHQKYYKYFRCPECKQQLRAPRKRGKIVVTCSKCKHRFDKKT